MYVSKRVNFQTNTDFKDGPLCDIEYLRHDIGWSYIYNGLLCDLFNIGSVISSDLG